MGLSGRAKPTALVTSRRCREYYRCRGGYISPQASARASPFTSPSPPPPPSLGGRASTGTKLSARARLHPVPSWRPHLFGTSVPPSSSQRSERAAPTPMAMGTNTPPTATAAPHNTTRAARRASRWSFAGGFGSPPSDVGGSCPLPEAGVPPVAVVVAKTSSTGKKPRWTMELRRASTSSLSSALDAAVPTFRISARMSSCVDLRFVRPARDVFGRGRLNHDAMISASHGVCDLECRGATAKSLAFARPLFLLTPWPSLVLAAPNLRTPGLVLAARKTKPSAPPKIHMKQFQHMERPH
ncbi:unnamed protein product, partial [Ectocarpus sp. 12 AP-2014]